MCFFGLGKLTKQKNEIEKVPASFAQLLSGKTSKIKDNSLILEALGHPVHWHVLCAQSTYREGAGGGASLT